MPSKEYKAYEKHCAMFMPKLEKPISNPVNVQCTFYRSTKRRVDLINLLECVADILVTYKVLADDNRNIMYAVDGSRVLLDRDNPRVEIGINEVEWILDEKVERW